MHTLLGFDERGATSADGNASQPGVEVVRGDLKENLFAILITHDSRLKIRDGCVMYKPAGCVYCTTSEDVIRCSFETQNHRG
jgi:hypothetical protein